MNKALLMVAAAGFAGALATGAMAQPTPPAPPAPPQAQPGTPPPPPGPAPQPRGPMQPGDAARMPGMPGMPGMYGIPGHRHGRHGPPPSRAAAFHIERGDISISVRCAQDESTQACVDAAIRLMEKAGTLTTP